MSSAGKWLRALGLGLVPIGLHGVSSATAIRRAGQGPREDVVAGQRPVRLISLAAVILVAVAGSASAETAQAPGRKPRPPRRRAFPGSDTYAQYCGGCHGAKLEGGSAGSLLDREWLFGGDDRSILASIRDGRSDTAMVAFGEVLEPEQLWQRFIFDADGKLLYSIGDRGRPDMAQGLVPVEDEP